VSAISATLEERGQRRGERRRDGDRPHLEHDVDDPSRRGHRIGHLRAHSRQLSADPEERPARVVEPRPGLVVLEHVHRESRDGVEEQRRDHQEHQPRAQEAVRARLAAQHHPDLGAHVAHPEAANLARFRRDCR